MAWQPRHWTSQQLEERRRAAGRLLSQGRLSQAEVARRMGISEAAVSHWARRLDEAGGCLRGLSGERQGRCRVRGLSRCASFPALLGYGEHPFRTW
ncbi:sigma-70 region 4 domain-containing protein [Myxococcus sp. CA056]|nr:sigma-70 region 4 domain-containing protein [Myxococcus sp. CA056]